MGFQIVETLVIAVLLLWLSHALEETRAMRKSLADMAQTAEGLGKKAAEYLDRVGELEECVRARERKGLTSQPDAENNLSVVRARNTAHARMIFENEIGGSPDVDS